MKSTFKWSLMLTSVALSGAIAIGQPGNQPPPPPPRNNPPPKAGQPPRPHMTPEERRKETEDRMRAMMTDNGITDTATQDAVLAYLANELQARGPLRRMGVKLQRALGNPDISDDQIKGLIADYQNAQDLENQRRTKAQSDLDAQIHYSQNPRLQGLLMLMGVLGDGPPLMQGPREPNQRDGNNRPNQNPNEGKGTNPEMRQKMLQMFDKDHDGKLDATERAAMQAYRQQQRAQKEKGDNAPPPANGQMDDDN
jgi:hypothetical protein